MSTSLTLAELPADVAEIARDAAAFIGVDVANLFIADHAHEELSEGAYSIAYEGAYEWPWNFTEDRYVAADKAGRRAFYPTRHLEAGTGWYLAVYPAS